MISKDRIFKDTESLSKSKFSDSKLINSEYRELLEKSLSIEENAEVEAEKVAKEDEIDIQMLAAVSEFNSNKSLFLFRPDSTSHMIWDFIGFFIIAYQSIVVPFEIWFDVAPADWLSVWEDLMDYYFYCDILICFNTGIYVRGLLVMERWKVILSYLTGWFLIDIVSTFPYSTVMDAIIQDTSSSLSNLSKTPRLLRMLKIIRFLRIVRVLRVIKLK